MTSLSFANAPSDSLIRRGLRSIGLKAMVAGLMLSLGFAPFHFPGLALLSLSILYGLLKTTPKKALTIGFYYGFSFFSSSIGWIMISIREYGHLHPVLALFITIAFICYLTLFTCLFTRAVGALQSNRMIFNLLSFASLWALCEYLRSYTFTGFPWVLVAHGQVDSPLKAYLPYIGVFGTGFITALVSALLFELFNAVRVKRAILSVVFMSLIFLPSLTGKLSFTKQSAPPLTLGVVQANLSMRDKWDEALFWRILDRYDTNTRHLFGKDLIVLPESAIPLPVHYISDYINNLRNDAASRGSAILIGVPEALDDEESHYYNTILALGRADGFYRKQHLVPFGEYIPTLFKPFTDAVGVQDAGLVSGHPNAPLITVKSHPIVSLICYEIAYGNILRSQLPKGQLIVSVSDDGWFGKSQAPYQHLQMAQALSLMSGRDQVLANNDGLSSVISYDGDIKASLPAFSAGLLESSLTPRQGMTPWVYYGDKPIVLFLVLMVFAVIWHRIQSGNPSAHITH